MSTQEDAPTILVAALGRHQVTMTNPSIGTVQLSREGFYKFRRVVTKRGVVGKEDTQSDVLCELGACFEAATRLPARDSRGNLLLLDKETDLLFVIEDRRRILLTVFDKRLKREKKPVAAKARQTA